jgi:hypothetical protein
VSPLLFILRRSLVNIVKGLAKKPGILALYVLLAIFFVAMLAFAIAAPGNFNHGDPRLYRSIITVLSVIVYYFSLRQGIEKGSSLFRAADVNLVFAGPFRPNDALLYGFIKQLGGMLLILFVAVFQIPNLKNNFALLPYGIWVILLAVAVYALSYPIFGMILYAYASKSGSRKRLASLLVNAAFVAVLLLFLYNLYGKRDLMQALYVTFDGPAVGWIPVVGWTRDIAAAAVDGMTGMFSMGLALMIAVIAAFIIILYRQNLDYYEEVLAATEYREAAIAAKKEGRNMQFDIKARRRVRQPVYGHGASALFGKNMLELRKSAFILFFDRTSAIVIVAALAFKFLMPAELGYGLFIILCFSTYMLFLLQMQGRWPNELGRHFIFTMPASAPAKLFFVTASDHIKNFIDGVALFVIAGVSLTFAIPDAYPNLPVALMAACIFAYVCLGAVFIYADVLARRIFGAVHSKPLQLFLKLFLTFVVVTPGIVAAVIVAVLMPGGNPLVELFITGAFGLWAFVAAGAVFAIASGIFKNIEASE